MRKMIFMAVAGFLWKKLMARQAGRTMGAPRRRG